MDAQLSTQLADIELDKRSDEPLYQQLIQYFHTQIASGRLAPGTRLPPSRDLARQLGIGRISVVSAYNELQAKGLISAHPGRGTFVSGAEKGQKTSVPAPLPRQHAPRRHMREMLRLAEKPGVIAFNSGTPPLDFLPIDPFRRAIETVLERDGAAAITYADPEGYLPLRTATRDYLTSIGIDCRAENILITGGAQQALDLVVQSILHQGDILLTANPTYIGILDIAHVRRVVPMGLPTDSDGIRLDALEDVLIEHRPKLLYVNPTFTNPTGAVMPIHRRRQLLRLAHDYKLLILEDAVYHELHFDQAPPPPLKALDEHNVVLHASGFSKILLPGTRIGYLIAEGEAREEIARVKQAADICTPSLNQRAVHTYMKRGGLPAHLDRVRHILRARRDAAVEAAERYFPDDAYWEIPSGGLYLWVAMPEDGPTAPELYVAAVHHGVAFAMGNLFYTDGDGQRFMRLNFGTQTPKNIHEGFRRLGEAWQTLREADLERKPIL